MKFGLRRKLLPVLVLSFVFGGVALAALPLALLVEPAANFAAGLLVRTAARQTIVSMGVAANDASWIVPLTNLLARAASILRIVGSSFEYELPLIPGEPIPPTVAAPSGAPGTAQNPISIFETILRIKPTNSSNLCNVPSNFSTDGQSHYIQIKWYTLAELVTACNGTKGYWTPASGMSNAAWGAVDQTTETSTYNVDIATARYYLRRWKLFDGNTNSSGVEGSEFQYTLVEGADGVKRFTRSAEGFAPDATDPDWTQAEKSAFASPSAVKFTDAAGQVVRVAANANTTQIDAASQAGADVKVRTALLNANAQATSVNEQVVTNAQAADVVATNPALNTNNGTGSITLPTDYARAGEAATAATAAAAQIVQALDASSVDSVSRPWKDIQEPEFNGPKSTIENTGDPDIPWQELLPNFTPGQAVTCKPIQISFDTPSASGLTSSGSEEINLCSFFEVVRVLIGYIFAITTMLYVWRRFTGSQSSEA